MIEVVITRSTNTSAQIMNFKHKAYPSPSKSNIRKVALKFFSGMLKRVIKKMYLSSTRTWEAVSMPHWRTGKTSLGVTLSIEDTNVVYNETYCNLLWKRNQSIAIGVEQHEKLGGRAFQFPWGPLKGKITLSHQVWAWWWKNWNYCSHQISGCHVIEAISSAHWREIVEDLIKKF